MSSDTAGRFLQRAALVVVELNGHRRTVKNRLRVQGWLALAVVAVVVGEEHAVGVAVGEKAGLLERHGGANAAAFANDADAALRWAIVMRTVVEKHAAAALGASLFR